MRVSGWYNHFQISSELPLGRRKSQRRISLISLSSIKLSSFSYFFRMLLTRPRALALSSSLVTTLVDSSRSRFQLLTSKIVFATNFPASSPANTLPSTILIRSSSPVREASFLSLASSGPGISVRTRSLPRFSLFFSLYGGGSIATNCKHIEIKTLKIKLPFIPCCRTH